MKKIIKALCLVGFFLFTMGISCNVTKKPTVFNIEICNNSHHSIHCYIAVGGKNGTCYPDSLPDTLPVWSLFELDSFNYQSGTNIRSDVGPRNCRDFTYSLDILKECPTDTVSIFIFHTDTLKKYSWKEIKQGYKILKRFDLSLKDLERMEYKVIFR